MIRSTSRWLRRCQFPLMMLLSAAPIALTQLCIHAPYALPSAYALSILYVALSSLCLLVPGSRRLLCSGGCAVVLFGASALLLPLRTSPLLLLVPALLVMLLCVSLPLAARRYESEVPPVIYVLGIGIHVVIQFLNHYFKKTGGSPYEPVDSALTVSLVGYMLLFLLSMNRISLDNASLARHRIPAGMRTINTLMTLSFAAVSLMLALFPAVVRGVTALWAMLSGLVYQIGVFLLSLFPSMNSTSGGVPGGMPPMLQMGEEAAETSPLAVLLEKIASVLTLIFIVVGTIFLLQMLIRLIMRAVRRLAERLRQYMAAASAEYDDEITNTREDGTLRELRFLRRPGRHAPDLPDTPAGRVRQTYARLLRRRPQWASSSTARENLPAAAAEIYERARYSQHPVTPEDVQHFTDQIKTGRKG